MLLSSSEALHLKLHELFEDRTGSPTVQRQELIVSLTYEIRQELTKAIDEITERHQGNSRFPRTLI